MPASFDTWRHAYVPRCGEIVRSLGWDRLCVVAGVDEQRGRALLVVDHPDCASRRAWEYMSLLRPHKPCARHADALRVFVADCCHTGIGLWVATVDLRRAYAEYCERMEADPLPWWGDPRGATVANALGELGAAPATRWTGPPGSKRQRRGWRGIGLK